MPPITRILVLIHVICRYRLISLLPRHPARGRLLILQYLLPARWRGTA